MENGTKKEPPAAPTLSEVEQLADALEEREETAAGPTRVTLSDGRVVELREATGLQLEKAAAVAANPTNPMSLFMAVVGQVAYVGDRRLIYEEVRALKLMDVMALIGAVGGNVPGAFPG